MKIQKQLFRHNPSEGVYGDCHRTCIASLLDMEPSQVPNFGEHYEDPDRFHAACDAYLRDRGLATITFVYQGDLEVVLQQQSLLNPHAYYLLGGTSKNGVGHTVVCKGGEIVCDPSLDDSGIVGPMDDGLFWLTFLVPLYMVAA